MKIKFFRYLKRIFFKYKLHIVIEPVSSFLLTICYLSKVSRWINTQEKKFRDFSRWDYNKRFELYGNLCIQEPINYLEFGVSQGHSFKWWVNTNTHPLSEFRGYDTFEGLPEDWGGFNKGEMQSGVPEIDDSRVKFYKGLFQNTLYNSLRELDAKKKVILMDADCYNSTLFVLTTLAPTLRNGDIIIFDQFNIPMHEFKAFVDFTQSFMIKLELINTTNNFYFTAFKFIK